MAINTNRTTPEFIALPLPADRYRADRGDLEDSQVQLNGHELALGAGRTSRLQGNHIPSGALELAPASIAFLAVADAGNRGCYDQPSDRVKWTSSVNRKRASAVEGLELPDFSFKRLQIGDRPLYNDDADQSATVKKLKVEIKAAGGLQR